MPNLALHQLRVAAVASLICDSLAIKVDKESIIKACLLHDMGNIIKFKLDHFPKLNEPEGLDYWQGIKYDFILKYGNNEHQASLEIATELDLDPLVLDLIDCVDSALVEIIALKDDFNKKICLYADNRVAPHGVVSAEEHSLDAKERYKNHPHAFSEESRVFFNQNLFEIENQIFSHSNLKPEEINDETISEILENLREFSI